MLNRVSSAPPSKDTSTVDPVADGIEEADDSPPVFPRGACLGRYVVLGTIGCGGMGSIYRAYDPELDRKVAIKVLHRDILSSEQRPRAQARLRREARATAKLAHPNVVAVHDVGTAAGCVFVAMELIEGQSLAEWLKESPRPWAETLRHFLQAGRGLAAAHRAGLVHRDFKPANVMLARDGRVVVVDFGLARTSSGASPGGEPAVGSADREVPPAFETDETTSARVVSSRMLGTRPYVAPEQRSGRRVDPRADQYSFCVALYRALYGVLPPSGEAPETSRAATARRGFVRSRPRSEPPARIRQALLRGMSRDPAARFPAMDVLLAALGDGRSHWSRKMALLALGGLAIASVILALTRQDPASLCAGGDDRLQGVWDASRRARLGQHFASLESSYAQDLRLGVERTLDAYGEAWVTEYVAACEATHLRGEQSPRMLDRRMACLDQRLLEMRQVTDLLLRGDRQILERSGEAVGSLARLDACQDRRALLSLPPARSGKAGERQRAARAKVAAARALEAAGRFQEATALAGEALGEAERLGDPWLAGEAHFWLGIGHGRQGRFDRLRQELLQAARMATAARDDDLLARSLIRLIITGWLRADLEDAHDWAELAAAVIERLGGRDDLEALRRQSLCLVALQAARHEEAVQHCRAALGTDSAMPDRERAIALNNLGIAFRAMGRHDEALASYRRSLALVRRTYGPRHPQYGSTLGNIGTLLAARGELAQAELYQQRALLIAEETSGHDNPLLVPPLTNLAAVLRARGSAEAALPLLERALALEPADPSHLATIRFELAETLWEIGRDLARARLLADQAHEAFERLGEPYRNKADEARRWLEVHRR